MNLSTSVDGLSDEAGLADNFAAPVEATATVFDERHTLSAVAASATQHATAAVVQRTRVAQPAAGTQ